VHTARAQGCKSQWLCDKHNCPHRDSIPGPLALQSDMLLLDHCDLVVNGGKIQLNATMKYEHRWQLEINKVKW